MKSRPVQLTTTITYELFFSPKKFATKSGFTWTRKSGKSFLERASDLNFETWKEKKST